MHKVSNYLAHDHSRCDGLYADAVAHVAAHDWDQAAISFLEFAEAMRRHVEMEERVVYPAFEELLANTAAPTQSLHAEHHLLCEIMHRMGMAIQRRDVIEFSDHADTFRLITEQHNLKEEGILFPMFDKLLRPRYDELVHAMDDLRDDHARPND
ncbi:hemerythrin domain-containing protein [Rugamonas apoptosis]|uniref:Hemerythrin domain-containing protein n=1 Tax=Rugamonas apoptosis TaxID=2758570 RepID=A0A7W2FA01_9BURK|nr:hemerythrin domain-containing protein [Rugamonas apoptosis]MBA5687851.1 hemerythrin domain-containing protein [Rugamonas apoptosis]